MHRKIKILPPELSQKIAAGEVIERPAQAVKELVENSVDAESTEIFVEIEKGGKLLIKVTDNGTGIRGEDLKFAFSRHSTSKITKLADLENITTLGFRGEALASLASCSRIEAVTKSDEDDTAIVMRIEGGKETYKGETARRRGVTIAAKDLFYNFSPRRKFLKSDSTEAGHIINILSQTAIIHNNIHFRLVMDGNTVFDLPKDMSFERRVGEVYGREIEKELIKLRVEKDGMEIGGGMLPPTFVRNNRELQIFIVNKRPVRSPLLSHAVGAAFQSIVPSGKFPVVFILLEVPPGDLDANIHPTKREIKFAKERDVHGFVVAAIRIALQNMRPAEEIPLEKMEIKRPAREAPVRGTQASFTVKSSGDNQAVREDVEAYLDEMMGSANIKGQVKDTYLVIEKDIGLELVDQHAAHERILYEGLKKDIANGPVERQALLFPISIELGLAESVFLKEKLEWFKELGIEVEAFGKNTFNVRTLPGRVKAEKAKEFIIAFIEELSGVSGEKGIADLRDEALKIMACRASIMAGDRLSEEERGRLVAELEKCKDNMTCPHGRPIKVVFAWDEIGKRFKR